MIDWDDDGDVDAGDWALSLIALDTTETFVDGGRTEEDRTFRRILVIIAVVVIAVWWGR